MKNLVLDQITYCADGSIGLKLFKQVIVDGEIVASIPHRVPVMPDQTVSEVMEVVNVALARDEKYPPLDLTDIEHADAVRDLVMTNPKVAARRDAWVAQKEAMLSAEGVEAVEMTKAR